MTVISDPEVPAQIKVVKLDQDTQLPLGGATFKLYADTNKNEKYDVGVDQLVDGPTVVPATGYTFATQLFWGTYFVEESAKPDLYDFGAVTVKKVVIERKDAGTTVTRHVRGPADPSPVTVDKVWFINGVRYTGGLARDGFSATLGLVRRRRGTVDWGTSHGGYLTGQTATITEGVTVPANCTPVDSRVTEMNGRGLAPTIVLGQSGYVASLPQLANHYTVTNTVTCTTKITLQEVGAVRVREPLVVEPLRDRHRRLRDGHDGRQREGALGGRPYALGEADGTAAPAGISLKDYRAAGRLDLCHRRAGRHGGDRGRRNGHPEPRHRRDHLHGDEHDRGN